MINNQQYHTQVYKKTFVYTIAKRGVAAGTVGIHVAIGFAG